MGMQGGGMGMQQGGMGMQGGGMGMQQGGMGMGMQGGMGMGMQGGGMGMGMPGQMPGQMLALPGPPTMSMQSMPPGGNMSYMGGGMGASFQGHSPQMSHYGNMPGSMDAMGHQGNMIGNRDLSPPSRGGGRHMGRTASGPEQVGGMPPGPPGGGMTGEVLAMMQHMQATMEAMRHELYGMSSNVAQQLADQQKFSQEREAWLEHRLNQLERRCEKAERASDRLNSTVQNWDFDELVQNQRKLVMLTTKGTTVVQNKVPASPSATGDMTNIRRTLMDTESSPVARLGSAGQPGAPQPPGSEARMNSICRMAKPSSRTLLPLA